MEKCETYRIIIAEKMFRINKPLFVDLEKALDEVSWTNPFTILENTDVYYVDKRIIYNVCYKGIVIIKTSNEKSWIDIYPGQNTGIKYYTELKVTVKNREKWKNR